MDVRLEDGTIVKNVPEGTTKVQLLQKLGRLPKNDASQIQDDSDPESDQGFIGGALNSAAQGATLGFGDEIQAMIAAAVASPFVSDKTFTQLMVDARNSLRADQEKFSEENPGTDLALQVAGGLTSGGAFAGAAKQGGKELLKQGAKFGAAAGAGFSDSEELISVETIEDSLKGATFGAVGSILTPAVIKGVAKTGQIIPKSWPESLMASSLKIRPSVDDKVRSKMIRTALDEGIMPTTKGLQKITDKISSLDLRLNQIIDDATEKGTQISKKALFQELKQLRKDLGGAKLDAADDLGQIESVAKAFDLQLKSLKKSSLSPREVQDLKRSAYQRIKFDVNQQNAKFAETEAKKAIVRGAKNSLEEINPDVKAINQKEGSLLSLGDELERAVNRIGNRNIISLDTAAKVSAGAATGAEAGAAAGAVISALGWPLNKARNALILENIRIAEDAVSKLTDKHSPELVGAISVMVGSYQGALQSYVAESGG